MIINVFRKETPNRGDLASAPMNYVVSTHKICSLDVQECDGSASKNESLLASANAIIIGGGGLLDFEKFDAALKNILSNYGNKTVIWGVGSNSTDGFVSSGMTDKAALVGVRDFPPRDSLTEWVPCASCLHPMFRRLAVLRRLNARKSVWRRKVSRIGIVENNAGRNPISIDPCGFEVEKVGNKKTDMEEMLRFINSKTLVVSNSYHGCYWATLLGVPVIGVPTSSKFRFFPHQLPLAGKRDWAESIGQARVYPHALRDSLVATYRYILTVNHLIGGLRLEAPKPQLFDKVASYALLPVP